MSGSDFNNSMLDKPKGSQPLASRGVGQAIAFGVGSQESFDGNIKTYLIPFEVLASNTECALWSHPERTLGVGTIRCAA